MFDSLPDAARAPIKPCLNILSGLLSMSIDLGFQEPRWVAYPLALHTPRSTPSSLSSLPAPCVLDASVLVPSLPWTLDLFCLHSGLSLVHLLTHLSISQTRLMHDFDFQGGHSLSYRASPDAAGPTQTPSKRNPALLSLVPAGAWKAALCPTF